MVAALVVLAVATRNSEFAGSAEEAGQAGRSYVPQPLEVPAEAVLFREVFSVTDVTARNGIWYVLDGSGMQVHRLHPTRGHLGSFGAEGDGPGEFTIPMAIVAHGDSIIVVDTRTLHLFDPAGAHLDDRILALAPGCFLHDAVSLAEGLVLMARCGSMGTTDYYAILETGGDEPLQVLSSRSTPRGDFTMGVVVMGQHPRGVLFGLPYERCLSLIDPAGTALDDVCHEWIQRFPMPVMTDDIAEEMEALKQRSRELGFRVSLPDELPPFKRVSITADGRLVYHAAVPGNDTGMRLVVQSEAGEQVVLPVTPARWLFVDGNNVLAAWEELEGARVLFETIP